MFKFTTRDPKKKLYFIINNILVILFILNLSYCYMYLRKFATIKKAPIQISLNAWHKMTDILTKSDASGFLFFAKGGGCNGFNYKLEPINEIKFNTLLQEKPTPTIISNEKTQLMIEPMSEMLLLGTTIDYVREDYSKNIFESRFIFTPEKDFATACGCGISFSPK